jgi:hypothetical protein
MTRLLSAADRPPTRSPDSVAPRPKRQHVVKIDSTSPEHAYTQLAAVQASVSVRVGTFIPGDMDGSGSLH